MNAIGADEELEGTVLEGKYLLERQLGVGGMGQVFLARDTTIDRQVAIKVLHDNLAGDESVRERFKTEAKAIARLRHPNCVMLYEFGISEQLDALFAVFEYVEGSSLEKWSGKQLRVSDIIEIGRQVALGVEHAHGQKIIHRDLKPDNIMVVVDEEGELEVKILDFGIARIAEDGDEGARLTKIGQMFGTPPYMSPEQIRAKLNVTQTTDIYSIGIILYELIEGRLPFLGETPIETVMMHINDELPPMVREDVPQELLDIVQRCLEKNSEDRFNSAKELAQALSELEWSEVQNATGVELDIPGAPTKKNLKNSEPEEPASEFEDIATSRTQLAFGADTDAEEVGGEIQPDLAVEDTAPEDTSEEDAAVLGLDTERDLNSSPAPAAKAQSNTTSPTLDDESDRIPTLMPMADNKKRMGIAAAIIVVVLLLGGVTVLSLSSSGSTDGEPGEVEGEEQGVAVVEPEDEESGFAEELTEEFGMEDELEKLDEGDAEFAEEVEEEVEEVEEVRPTPRADSSPPRERTGQTGSEPANTTQQAQRPTPTPTPTPPRQEEEDEDEGTDEEVVEPRSLSLQEQRRRLREEPEEEDGEEQPAGLRIPGRN